MVWNESMKVVAKDTLGIFYGVIGVHISFDVAVVGACVIQNVNKCRVGNLYC